MARGALFPYRTGPARPAAGGWPGRPRATSTPATAACSPRRVRRSCCIQRWRNRRRSNSARRSPACRCSATRHASNRSGRLLAARAERLGLTLPVVATTHDPALCIVSGIMRFAPIRLRWRPLSPSALPALPDGARLRSRCAVPSALRPWLEDRRRLGVMVRGIVLRCGDRGYGDRAG